MLPPRSLHSLLVFLGHAGKTNATDAMKTTRSSNETVEPLGSLHPELPSAEFYSLPGSRISLQTDSVEVRDFFRAA